MIHFKDWLQIREMSASGRRKRQAALGLAPPVADIFSRSTPPPWQVDKLSKALDKSKKKKKKKKKKSDTVVEAKKSQPIVHKDIDAFIKSVEGLAKDIWELDLLKKKKVALDKMDQIAKKNVTTKKSEKPIEKPDEAEKEEKKELPEKEKEKEKPNERIRKPVSKPDPRVIARKKPLKPKPKLGAEAEKQD